MPAPSAGLGHLWREHIPAHQSYSILDLIITSPSKVTPCYPGQKHLSAPPSSTQPRPRSFNPSFCGLAEM